MPYTKLGQVNIPLYYQIHHLEEKQPLVIFVNGWCLSDRYWQPCIERISAQFPALTYDARGFGRSRGGTIVPDFHATIDSGTDELLELTRKLNLWDDNRTFHVVGHSLGAVIAAHFATRVESEGRLASLTIINSGSFDESEPQGNTLNTFVKIFVNVKGLFDLPLIRKAVVGRSVALPIPPQYERVLSEDIARSDRRLALELSLSSLELINLKRYRQELISIKSPLLLIVGDKDATIPPKGMYNIKQLKPQSSFVPFADCGHLPMLEQPDRFAKTLLKHFTQQQGSLLQK